MLRKIAIVGANGFVGRHLVELLSRRSVDVIGIVRSEEGAQMVERLGGTAHRVSDLEETATQALKPVLASCDALVYTASTAAGRKPMDRTNPEGLVNVARACAESGTQRFVFFSGLGIAHYGINPHCTNPYFLAKMAGEVALFRSSLSTTVFRPSYIFGPGDEFLSPLIRRMATDEVMEIPGDGQYRLQPISVWDTASAIVSALDNRDPSPRVVDLVGPQILSYRALIGRLASIMGRTVEIRERAIDEALAQARQSGYFGFRPHDLACLLCDEVSDPEAVQALVGAELESVDSMLARTVATVGSHLPSA